MTSEFAQYASAGELVGALLSERGWTKQGLAVALRVDPATVTKVLSGRRSVDAKLALGLADVFDVPPEVFLSLQNRFDLTRARGEPTQSSERADRAHLFGALPVREMIKRGWIEAESPRDVPVVERELLRFFGARAVEEIEILPHAAKKTDVAGNPTAAQMAWIHRVKQLSAGMVAGPFSDSSARAALHELTPLLASELAARNVPRILAECGIRFVLVESLKGAKIDGACFWLDESRPVVAMSLRHDRIDNFWFVLRHELEHVLQRHGRSEVMLDAELEGNRAGTGEDVAEQERVANRAAAEFCVPPQALESFIARKAPYFRKLDIVGFARLHRVHPGLVAGQLQHRTGEYRRFREFQTKIRQHVLPSAMVDGWGDVAPTEREETSR